MSHLKRTLFLLGFFGLLLCTFAFSTVGSTAADSTTFASLQAPPIELSLSVSPANIEPGQQATVIVKLTNLTPGPLAPEIQISLPSGVSTRLNDLPSGTIYNAQSGVLVWQPVMAGGGAELTLSLPVIAKVADVQAPEQTISAIARAGGAEISQDATFWIGLTPVASIRMVPPQVAVGQPLRLLGAVNAPGPISQLWSLGDGRIVEATDPTVLYPAPGNYEVVFQASTPFGVVSVSESVNVVGQAIARFEPSDYSPAVGVPVAFANESGGQHPLTYLWDFGDGSISTDPQPTHIFQTAGTYDVRLYVTGPNGQSESLKTLTVGPAPAADFVIGEAIEAGTPIQGQAFTDDTVTSLRWDMGDGHVYEGELVNHVYWSAGDYSVVVTVANEFGEVTLHRNVHVNPGPLYLFLPLVYRDADATATNESSPEAGIPETAPAPEGNVTEVELQNLDLPADLSKQEQLLAYINEARRINGLGALALNEDLSSAAQSHADDMASNGITSHAGSDGSVPAYRILTSGYPGGYAGEATAWGMADAIEPVRFWLDSLGHRVIILNPAARDVGVGFGENFTSPSVWYWTAEFASLDLPVVYAPPPASAEPPPEPVLALLGPPSNGEFLISTGTELIFTWSWPEPMAPGERFAIYMNSRGRTVQIGTVTRPELEDQYQFTVSAGNIAVAPGLQEWFVVLEDTMSGASLEQSDARPILFLSQP